MKNTILTILILCVLAVIAIFAPNTNWWVYAILSSLAFILNIEPIIKLIVKLFKISYKNGKLEIEEESRQDDVLN